MINTEIELTQEIYEHLSNFLRNPAQARPILGCVYMRGERAYAADGYSLYDFPLATINLEDWLEEHCYLSSEMGNEKPNEFYMTWDNEIDDLVPDVKKLGDLLPCATDVIDEKMRAYPNPDEIRLHDWQDFGEIDTLEIVIACYKAKQLWIGKGYAAMTMPRANLSFAVDKVETALSFPMILQSKTVKLQLAIHEDGHAIKLSANDCHVTIMGYLGDSTPLAEKD